MKKLIIRACCLCLILFMGLSVLASCGKLFGNKNDESDPAGDVVESGGDNGEGNKTESGSSDGSDSKGSDDTDEVDEDAERENNRPERVDYNKAEFVIAQSLNDKKQWIAPVEGKGSDAVNVALTKRNELLQTYFNIKIVINDYDNNDNKSTTIRNEFEAAAMSGKAISDIAFAVSGQIMKGLIINGFIEDVNTLEQLNLEASYYDQRLRQEYNIEGRLFCLEGDFGLHDELRTHVVGVNKSRYDTFGYNEQYGSLYDIVREGDWTLDLMLKMAKDTSDYASIGSNMTKDNEWGIISESPFPYVVYLGTGNKILNIDANGALTVSYSDPSAYALMEEMLQDITNKVVLENPETLLADASKGVLSETNYWGEAQGMFAQGKALFRTSTLVDFTKYADMDDEFGILPVPKYEEGQSFYYSWCSSQAHSPLFVPRNNENLDRAATIIEAMSYFSKYMSGNTQTVHDAFYQNMADAKLCLTVDDREMLTLIFSQRTFDLDHVLNISNTCNTIASAAKGSTTSIPAALANIQNQMTNPDLNTNLLESFLSSMRKYYND